MTKLRKGEDLTPYGIRRRMQCDMEMEAALRGALGLLQAAYSKFENDPGEEWRTKVLKGPMHAIMREINCCPTHSMIQRIVDERLLDEFVEWHTQKKEKAAGSGTDEESV